MHDTNFPSYHIYEIFANVSVSFRFPFRFPFSVLITTQITWRTKTNLLPHSIWSRERERESHFPDINDRGDTNDCFSVTSLREKSRLFSFADDICPRRRFNLRENSVCSLLLFQTVFSWIVNCIFSWTLYNLELFSWVINMLQYKHKIKGRL